MAMRGRLSMLSMRVVRHAVGLAAAFACAEGLGLAAAFAHTDGFVVLLAQTARTASTAQTAQAVQAAQPQKRAGAGAWLDAPLSNWNAKVTTIPHAVINNTAPVMDPRCAETQRSGYSPEDKLLTNAGWKLFGEQQQFDDVSLVMALSTADGMCRPLGYQGFVFVGGKLAGTVSPKPVDSRVDGSISPIHLTSTSTLTVGFNRYTESDALCCPSKRQIVTFKIERTGPRPLLVPRDVAALGR
jgi:hypothetical protein